MKILILSISIALIIISSIQAQETQSDFNESNEGKDWEISFTPYALLASQSTDVGGTKIRQSFSDLTSITNAGFQIVTAIRYKRVFFSFDGTFANLSINEQLGPIGIDVEIKQNIFDFKMGYIVYNNFDLKSNDVIDGWSLGFNIGGKYWENDVNIALSLNDVPLPEDSFTEHQEWWDLMIGVRMRFVVSPKFLVGVTYNAGGFGIGNSSKFASDFTYMNSFNVHKNILINAGFRSFSYKRVDGELTTKVQVLGPLLGVSFVF